MDRDAQIEKLKAQLNEWNAQMHKLEAQMREAQAEGRGRYQKYLDDVKEQQRQAQEQLDKLRHAGEGAWEDVLEGTRRAWEEYRKSLEKAWQRFRDED